VYLDGSFVTEKDVPSDYDACWCSNGVKVELLDPVFLDFEDTASQKAKYLGEFYVSLHQPHRGTFFVDYFQTDKITGDKKGIVAVSLTAPIPTSKMR
jgi:hypothetical protein